MAAELISFARGAPSPDLLPVEAVREAVDAALTEEGGRALSYGTGVGHPALAEWIATELHGIQPDRVMVTNGSLEAGWMVFDHFLGAGDEVIVEQPSYDRTLLMLERLDTKRIGVPLEADGVDVGRIETLIAEGAAPKLLHIIPNFHNPAGCTLSEAKRRRLVELSAEHGFVIFEDDPYRLVTFGEAPPPTMLSMAEGTEAKIVHASSFSKTVAPGIRVGYLAGPEDLVLTLATLANNTYISPNMLAGAAVNHLCRSGKLTEMTTAVNAALAERCSALVEALPARFDDVSFVTPGGGYFLWASFGDGLDLAAAKQRALDEAVAFVPGTDFMLEGGGDSLRLSFAGVPAQQIAGGVERLARALGRV
jgi:DNA-binding transcriptional MocR family regulator